MKSYITRFIHRACGLFIGGHMPSVGSRWCPWASPDQVQGQAAGQIMCDNKSAVAYINKLGGTWSKRLFAMAKTILLWCRDYNMWILMEKLLAQPMSGIFHNNPQVFNFKLQASHRALSLQVSLKRWWSKSLEASFAMSLWSFMILNDICLLALLTCQSAELVRWLFCL